MKKNNKTVKSLIFSAIGLLLCIVMLTGTTFAWLRQSATTGENTITTAGFNAKLQWTADVTDDSSWDDIDNTDVLYNNTGELRPGGYTDIKYLKITNGNDYKVNGVISIGDVSVNPAVEAETGKDAHMKLYYKVISITDPMAAATKEELIAANSANLDGISTSLDLGTAELAANGTLIVAIMIGYDADAITPSVTTKFKLTATATQSE